VFKNRLTIAFVLGIANTLSLQKELICQYTFTVFAIFGCRDLLENKFVVQKRVYVEQCLRNLRS